MSTIIISGASKGIGRAIAQAFVDKGNRVINISRTPSPVTGIENHLLDFAGPETPSAIAELTDSTFKGSAKSDIVLIHNAARLDSDSVSNTDADSLRNVVEINIIAPQILNHALLPRMAPGSSILYIGSTLAEKAVPGSYSYVVTKHAMLGMMRATCQDLAGTGIHTACLCPGFTDTEMLRTHVGKDREILDTIAATSAFGRLIQPEEIAACIVFAAGNPVVNGAVIHANLGQLEG